MIYNILVVDDNQPFLNLVTKLFDKYRNRYAVHTCLDGLQATNMLSKINFTAVVTDLQMPNVDGYALLKQIRAKFPDVPVIVITSFDKPKTGVALKRAGAHAYFTKPLVIEDLLASIEEVISNETEGGRLHNASLEMFIQLIEMEAKTCTIRVKNEQKKKQGVLFFNGGDLYQARCGSVNGTKAAYEVFSWDKVTLSIENRCILASRHIEDDLQAILLESMRLKDEISASEEDFSEEISPKNPEKQPEVVKQPEAVKQPANKVAQGPPQTAKPTKIKKEGVSNNRAGVKKTPQPLSSEDNIKKKLSSVINIGKDIISINMNAPANNFVKQVNALGLFLGIGEMKAAFFDKNGSGCTYLLPSIGDKYIELEIRTKCPPDKIIKLLTE